MKKLVSNPVQALAATMLFFFFSCNQGADVTQVENNDLHENDIENPISMGALPEDPHVYDTYPLIDVNSLESIITENDTESRNGIRRINTPPVISQGGEGSCTAFASAYTISSYYMRLFAGMQYTNAGAIRSPEYVYNSTKLAGPCDRAGAYMSNVLTFLRNNGVCSWTEMPYSSYNGCSAKPNSYMLSQGSIAKIQSWNTVSRNVNAVKTLIDKGYPVVMVFDANSHFDKQALRMPAVYSSYKKTSDAGWHAVTIVGYDNQKQQFIVQNSWGTSYHDKGFFYITFALFPTIAAELYVMNPVIPNDFRVRNASKSDVKIRINSVEHVIKKGESKMFKSYIRGNDFDIWQCKVLCDWYGDFDPTQGKNYKIVEQGSKNYLHLVSE